MSFAQVSVVTTAIKLTPSHVAYWSLVQPCRLEAGATHRAVFIVGAKYISPESSRGRGMPRPYRSAGILAGKSAWLNPTEFHCQSDRELA